MPVALADLCRSVSARGQRVLLQHAGPCAQSHRPAHLFHAQQFAQFINDAVLAGGVELARVGVLQAADVARKLDARSLHAQTNSEVGHLFLAGVTDSVQHTLNAALAEASGNQDAVESG